MKKQLKKFLPLIVAVIVLILAIGARAWRLSFVPKDGRWPDVAGGTYATPVMKDGVNYFVPPDELYDNGMGKDGIPALNSPTYVTVAAADDVLADEVEGIDVAVNGEHRFYSFQILNWHELVNDKFGDKELLISYSPLCGSAVVYDRVVEDGITRTFGDNGQVYNDCPVLYDDKSTALWDQASGALVAGHDHAMTLVKYPSTVMSWSAWKKSYPNGEVLSTETGFARDYRRHPYGNYDNNTSLFFPVNKTDTRLGDKDLVYDFDSGFDHTGVTAKFLDFVKEPNFSTGLGEGLDFTVLFGTDGLPRMYDRKLDDQVLTFVRETNELKDKETGSRWSADGVAISGKLKGKKLRLVDVPIARYFAFAYISHFPTAGLLGSDVYDQAKLPAASPTNPTEPTPINVTP